MAIGGIAVDSKSELLDAYNIQEGLVLIKWCSILVDRHRSLKKFVLEGSQ